MKPKNELLNRKKIRSNNNTNTLQHPNLNQNKAKPKNFEKSNLTTNSNQGNLRKAICNFYINGACNKGSACTFSHEVKQVKKTDLCKFFMNNNSCFKGDDCLFSHDTQSFPCKYYHVVGYCEKGESCR